ncbi:MAG TPA: hypothetical protein VFV99_28455, partial [Kofleriaceae bacterium]|nr:hypothetical protein [Kofleriaceae bacterium]
MGRSLLAFALVMAMVSVGAAQPPPPAADNEQAQFDAAFDAMVRGDFGAASEGFKLLSVSALTPERRASSTELARLADELIARGGKLSFSTAPPGLPAAAPVAPVTAPPNAVVAVSEDDAKDGGRASFVITTTMASFYSGFVLVDLLDTGDDARVSTGVVMGATAAGVLGSVYGTKDRDMTGGMADAWGLGLFAGVGNALLLSEPLGLFDGTNASEHVNLFVLGAGWGVATAGLLVADKIRPTRGQVTVVETFGLMGVSSTLLSLAILQPDNLDGDSALTVTAAGLDGGLAAGAIFGDKLDWSHSRARLVELSAFLGGLAGVGTSVMLLSDSGSDDTFRAAAGITLAGLWGGFALGTHLTRNMQPDYRFRRGSTAMIAPTSIRNAPGLAL